MEKFDLIVFGKGIAGLSTAYSASIEAKAKSIAVLSKSPESNSMHSQGGIACALAKNDSSKKHYIDTIKAGAGLCGKKIVKILTTEGPKKINELIDLGLRFDSKNKKIDFGMEAAHSVPRILHINGDQTGKGITTFMKKLCTEQKNIHFIENSELVCFEKAMGKINSAIVLEKSGIKSFKANSFVLATGGYSSLWEKTTNPKTTTGEAIIAASEIGAKLKNLEFEQFHPTTLAIKGAKNFLISESVRGEGGILLNDSAERFMEKVLEKELAPRDVVSRQIYFQLMGGKKVFLDVSFKKKEFLEKRFPKIYSELKKFKISMEKDFIPIEPAAHYSIGGIQSNEFCETSVKGLYAVGECSCNGVHGANRLASNSLLEAVVFGFRTGKKAINAKTRNSSSNTKGKIRKETENSFNKIEKFEIDSKNSQKIIALEQDLKKILWKNCGIVRNEKGLKNGIIGMKKMEKSIPAENSIEFLKLKRELSLGKKILEMALLRKKSVGCHYREN